ncbi:MAG: UvrD-helicase domain-containing protein [Casimicrobiaceae bacterium]
MLKRAAATEEDRAERARALDVTRSFLVQAPAGSGKTELLIQRFLALLARVDRPEHVLAMTFTRKAAGEMRSRIIAALADAHAETPVIGAHLTKTRELACAALTRDRELNWQLLAHPARLAVQTIDALCAGLLRQAPLATRLGAMPKVEEHAQPLYRQAARDALAAADPDDPEWRALLAHLDNDADRVVSLLAAMLGKRDQWLRPLGRADPCALRTALESTLRSELEGELESVRQAFPVALAGPLAEVASYASRNLASDPARAMVAEALQRCAVAGGVPAGGAETSDDWRVLAGWLLVADHAQFRRVTNARQGLPKVGKGAGAAERKSHKTQMAALLAQMSACPGLADALHVARQLPPVAYDDPSWEMVAALLAILPRVAAQLIVTFAREGAVDFTQTALATLAALGESDAPTDLLLWLDMRIEHLLLDEFQDTSQTQYDLLARLTAGWSQGDGRTLFVVGDPMQSIYGFREAEVRLFLDAQTRRRIGDIPVEFVDLTSNFRSQANVVTWVNDVFVQVLAPRHDPWRGAVAFTKSTAELHPHPEIVPTLEVLRTHEDEAQRVTQLALAALAAGAPDVAILVRARPHLHAILPALRKAAVPFAAVDLDPLGARQATLDLVSLTHALTQPADRLAWLSVLRAPWCGLALPDLFVVAQGNGAGLPWALAKRHEDAAISGDGRARLARVAAVLERSLEARGRAPLVERVRGAWLALGGPACCDEPIDLAAADLFFALLAEYEYAGDVRDWQAFRAALDESRAAPESETVAPVKVMTLHRAKGLEFDTVILPGLARTPPRTEPELLRWRARPAGLMLAPMAARGEDEGPISAYLKRLGLAEADAELERLLYVGVTRAKVRVHLTAVLKPKNSEANEWQPPRTGTALHKLWLPVLNTIAPPETMAAVAAKATRAPLLHRLRLGWQAPPMPASVPLPASTLATARNPIPVFDWAHATAAAIGTVAHRFLAHLALEGLGAWPPERATTLPPRVRAALRSEGVGDASLATATAHTVGAIERTLTDERGRWIFSETHAEAKSEWALAGIDGNTLVHVKIDRTFVAAGERWIIDFKTGRHEGGDSAAFLDREVERYRAQLAQYARIVGGLDPRPIRLALYFPLVERGFREWAFGG